MSAGPSPCKANLRRSTTATERAREMLRPAPYPDEFPELKKLEALKTAGAYLEGNFYRPPITVNFKEGVNHVGVHQPACPLVGDCVTGCNYGAKNTTLMNYLPDARNHGAEIYVEVSVRRLERTDGGWLVHYDVLDAGREKFGAPELFIRADVVILGAGALGSTEILLRSAEHGLSLSERLGERFTGNGDVLGFGYNCDEPVLGIGFGDHAVGELPPVGPCITGIVDMREHPTLDSRHGDRGGRRARCPLRAAGQGLSRRRPGLRHRHRRGLARLRQRARPRARVDGRPGAYRGALNNTHGLSRHDPRRQRRAHAPRRRPRAHRLAGGGPPGDLPDGPRASAPRDRGAGRDLHEEPDLESAARPGPRHGAPARRLSDGRRGRGRASSTTRARCSRAGREPTSTTGSTSATGRSCRDRSASTRS